MTASTRVDEFEELRPHLLAVAYRLTGTVADAEDVVQDAWLRWDARRRESINDLRAWLTTVVSRLEPGPAALGGETSRNLCRRMAARTGGDGLRR